MMATAHEPPAPVPANVETEAALLGGLMYAPNFIDRVADRLSHEDFYEALHGRIYSAILKEHSLGRAPTPITLKPYFEADEGMREVGGPAYLAQITGSGAAVVGVLDFADQVVELARRRRLNAALEKIVTASHDYEKPFDQMVAEAETAIVEASRDFADGVVEVSFAQAAKAALEPETSDPGVTSGIEGLDKALGPIKPQQLVIVAGRPGMGKSTLARSYALGVAKQGHGVLLFTHEMGRDEIVKAMLADLSFNGHSGINHEAIAEDRLTDEQHRALARLVFEFENLPLQIIDAGSMTVARFDSTVRRWKRRFAARGVELKLVIDDYMQLLHSNERENNLYTQVTKVSQGLKAVMKKHEVGGLVLSQLSRQVEQREDKRPHLADLRDSGSIEQDADGVCFLFRPEYYLRTAEPEADSDDPKKVEARAKWERALELCQGKIEFIVAKRRGRRTGIGHGRFHGAFQAVR